MGELIERSNIRMSSSKILLVSCFLLSCTLTTKATRFVKQIDYKKSMIDLKNSNPPFGRIKKQRSKNTSLKYSIPVFKRKISEYFLKKIKSKKILSRKKRNIGSVKMEGILKKEYLEEQPFSPPSFVALVAIDLIAALFTFNAVAALLFVATRS